MLFVLLAWWLSGGVLCSAVKKNELSRALPWLLSMDVHLRSLGYRARSGISGSEEARASHHEDLLFPEEILAPSVPSAAMSHFPLSRLRSGIGHPRD